jgi:hypothetical protein
VDSLVYILLTVAGLYLAVGLLFAAAFLPKGITRVDEGAKGAGIWFKALILPGVVCFWPALLKKWIRSK